MVQYTPVAAALSGDQLDIFQKSINYFDACGASSSDSSPSTGTVGGSGGPIATSPSTQAGQPLGGVADTGFTQAEIDQAKARSSGSSFSGGTNFLATTYGPPWSAQEGSGVTSTGLSLAGPDNSHGRPRYVIAVDPNVIPYGSLVTVWPNALNWRGAFLAADTGGAIIGNHVDVYDWTGDGTKNSFSANGAKVEPYTGNLAGSSSDSSASTTSSSSCCSNSSSDTTPASSGSGGSGSVWSSGLQPPYIIEQFAIELLKDIASKTGVPTSSTVTKEHVTALVAFAIAEGGDIQNQDQFNLFNSGWPDPQFLASAHSVSGVQAFKSFDAGVEAISRHMTTGVQERLGGILSQPNSSADDFFKTLLDTSPYKGVAQADWAQPPPALSTYEGVVQTVKGDYKSYASIVIGTPAHEQADGTRDASKLDPTLAGSSGGPSTASSSGQCGNQCAQPDATGNTIVIDPGHGPSRTVRDAATGLNMVEQPGGQGDEIGHVWNVANIMKKDLEGAGYRVLLTKKSIDDTVTLRDRANTADQNNAVLALSIHGDESLGNPGEIYTQKVGLYRGQGSNKTVFSDASIADKSQQYAKIFQQERQKDSGQSVIIRDDTFDSRGIGMEPGNIPMVQLLSKTPWVYNEKHMPFDDNEYAKELEDSVKQAVPLNSNNTPSPSQTASSTGCAASGSIQAAIDLAMKYAWPDGGRGVTMKPEYAAAIKAAQAKGLYVGGISYPGVDCGGFVTRVMQDSGADPKYNTLSNGGKGGFTGDQIAYLNANSKPGDPNAKYQNLGKVSNPGILHAGDIAINSGHTWIYVGPESGHPSFHGDQASASLDSRAPNAETLGIYSGHPDGPFTFYRLVKPGS